MNKKLPLEEAIENKLQQLQPGGEEENWQEMKKLLDKNNRRRGIFYYKRFLGLLLFAGTALWFIYNNKTGKATITGKHNAPGSNAATQRHLPTGKNNEINEAGKTINVSVDHPEQINTGKKESSSTVSSFKNPVASGAHNEQKNNIHPKKHSTVGRTSTIISQPGIGEQDSSNTADHVNSRDEVSRHNILKNTLAATAPQSPSHNAISDDTEKVLPAEVPVTGKDSTVVISTKKADTMKQVTANEKRAAYNHKKQKMSAWSAGIGLQQQIPVDGQEMSAYGYNGSRRVIDNYIPSLYVKWQKKKNWFLRAEFGYGAPRIVPAFMYFRSTRVKENSTTLTTSALLLKKTYYHEIPVSFNYRLQKGWSAGAGITYSLLHRSISENTVTVKDLQSGTETSTTNIIHSGYTDSFLYRSQWQWFLQAEYEWKRFSAGLRYSTDMLPYIKFTSPAGELLDRKNKVLSLFVRVRLL